jgi:hypothetical protein
MNTDNTNRDAKPSPASAGSQPVAWAVALGDKGLVLDGIYISKAKADEVLDWRNQNTEYGARMIPLYGHPKPTLTDAEKTCLGYAIRKMDAEYAAGPAGVLRELLERLS